MKLKIKKGDTVEVITGSEKGKKGPILALNSKTLKVRVKGVRVQSHKETNGDRAEREGYIDYSNVKLIEKAATAAKKKTAKKAATK